MMKQNLATKMPPLRQNSKSNLPITAEERIFILEKSTKDAVLKLNKKKDFFERILNVRKEILEKAQVFDSLNSSLLMDAMAKLLPSAKNIIAKSSNADLAKWFISLYASSQSPRCSTGST